MPLIKGKDIPEIRDTTCGAMVKIYPIQPDNDFLDWILFRRSMKKNGQCSFTHTLILKRCGL